VLHTILDDAAPNKLAATENQALEDTAARYLTGLVFRAQPGTAATWGTATFHWGLDVERKELR
jgi:hypothetical protein